MANPAKIETVRYTILFLAAIGIITGFLLDNQAVFYGLIDTVNQSFLPGF